MRLSVTIDCMQEVLQASVHTKLKLQTKMSEGVPAVCKSLPTHPSVQIWWSVVFPARGGGGGMCPCCRAAHACPLVTRTVQAT